MKLPQTYKELMQNEIILKTSYLVIKIERTNKTIELFNFQRIRIYLIDYELIEVLEYFDIETDSKKVILKIKYWLSFDNEFKSLIEQDNNYKVEFV